MKLYILSVLFFDANQFKCILDHVAYDMYVQCTHNTYQRELLEQASNDPTIADKRIELQTCRDFTTYMYRQMVTIVMAIVRVYDN